jgi:hypothetical protein
MNIDIASIRRRLTGRDKRAIRLSWAEINEVVEALERAAPVLAAADAWARAIAEPLGMLYDEEYTLMKAVEAWREKENNHV